MTQSKRIRKRIPPDLYPGLLGGTWEKNCFVSRLVSLRAIRCSELRVKGREFPHEQVRGAVNISSAVVPQIVQPWTRGNLVVAFGVQSLAQGPMFHSFLMPCLGESFSLHHPPSRAEFGFLHRDLLLRDPMQVSLPDTARGVPGSGHREFYQGSAKR